MKLSVIIVNYNSAALTKACIESILSHPQPSSIEIIVVDNGSQDSGASFLRADFPDVTFIINKENRGLAAAVNQAVRTAAGDYFLLLNPDIVVLDDAISQLVAFMDANQKVGVSGGKLLSPNGQLQYSCFRFYKPLTVIFRRTWLGKTRWGQRENARFLMQDFDHAQVRDVDWLMGSCLMLRADAVKEVGGMDERFFLYFEDVDWCRRFWKAGWRVTWVPQARFSHFHQRSSRKHALFGLLSNWAAREHIRSAVKYFSKYGIT